MYECKPVEQSRAALANASSINRLIETLKIPFPIDRYAKHNCRKLHDYSESKNVDGK